MNLTGKWKLSIQLGGTNQSNRIYQPINIFLRGKLALLILPGVICHDWPGSSGVGCRNPQFEPPPVVEYPPVPLQFSKPPSIATHLIRKKTPTVTCFSNGRMVVPCLIHLPFKIENSWVFFLLLFVYPWNHTYHFLPERNTAPRAVGSGEGVRLISSLVQKWLTS